MLTCGFVCFIPIFAQTASQRAMPLLGLLPKAPIIYIMSSRASGGGGGPGPPHRRKTATSAARARRQSPPPPAWTAPCWTGCSRRWTALARHPGEEHHPIVRDSAAARARIAGPAIAGGAVLEEGASHPESEPDHRHVSHLVFAYPGPLPCPPTCGRQHQQPRTAGATIQRSGHSSGSCACAPGCTSQNGSRTCCA
jgi:hypothetical protein